MFVPLPSCPSPLYPHPQAVPSDFNAWLCSFPAAIAVTPVRLLTCTGIFEFVVVPLPSWAWVFNPQAHTVPSDFSARLWKSPAATAVAPVSELTFTGTDEFVVVPLPSSPNWLSP